MRIISFCLLLLTVGCCNNGLTTGRLADFPTKDGVTGAATGLINDSLVVAGGCYFPNKKPWEGGKKFWDNKIYVLDSPEGQWRAAGILPQDLSYSASFSQDKGLFILGGEDTGKLTDSVLKLTMVGQQVKIDQLAPLPEPLSKASVTTVNERVYIFGGKSAGGATNKVWSAPLPYAGKWRQETSFPFGPRTACSVISKNNKIYIFSGRSGNKLSEIKVHKDVWEFFPTRSEWKKLVAHKNGVAAMSTPITLMDGEITLLGSGGSDDLSLHDRIANAKQIEVLKKSGDISEADNLLNQNRQLMKADLGHSGTIRKFYTEDNSFEVIGKLPKGRVGTKAISWHGGVVIPCGEVRPGVRTTKILYIKGVKGE